MYRKNTASQYIYFVLVKATDGTALTGATVTAYRALDSGSQASATGTTTELANGQYRFNLSQADTNADYGSYLFTATNAVPVEKTVVFTQANPTDATAFGLSRLDAAITSRLAPTVAGRTLDVTATGAAGIDWGNVENQQADNSFGSTTIYGVVNTLSATINEIVPYVFVRAGLILARGTVVASTSTTVDLAWQTSEPSLDLVGALAILSWDDDGGRVGQTRIITDDAIVPGFLRRLTVHKPWSSNPDPNVPDEITIVPGITACERYYDPDSGGYEQFPEGLKYLSINSTNGGVLVDNFEPATGLRSVLAATATAGSATTITLGASGSAVNDTYTGLTIVIYGGTGAYQSRAITAYDGSTKVATVDPAWATAPNSTSQYVILPLVAASASGGDASQTTLLQVKAKTDLISATNVSYSGPVDPTGKIAAPIIRGDDYLAANNRAFTWTFSAIAGLSAATCTSRLGFKSGTTTLVVNGTVTDNGNGTWTASHDMTRTQSATLTQQQYDWSVEILEFVL
jgi:hypothetical protein